MGKRIIVLANGIIKSPAILRGRLSSQEVDLVVAANGGSNHAKSLGLTLDAIVGDLDSLDEEGKATFLSQGVHIQISRSEKDETDLELALLYAVHQGAEEIIVLGAFGGRIDMCIANLLLLAHPQLAKVRIQFWHGNQTAWIIRPPGGEVHGRSRDTLSLIPINGDAEGITTHNLAYPLKNERLFSGPARGVSNLLTDNIATIELRSGVLLAVHAPGHA
jgi:thiamine pyrophosphokinase